MKQPCKCLVGTLVSLVLFATGCSTAPPTSLSEMRKAQARELVAQCYMEREGERLLFGPGPVFTACSKWAHALVRVRYGQSRAPQPTAFGTK